MLAVPRPGAKQPFLRLRRHHLDSPRSRTVCALLPVCVSRGVAWNAELSPLAADPGGNGCVKGVLETAFACLQ